MAGTQSKVKKNMAQAMTEQKGRGQTIQDFVRHVDATT